VAQKALNLRVSTPLGQRDDPAHPFEQFIPADDFERVEAVDGRSKHDPNEPIDMTTGPIDRERHAPAPFEPSAKHQIVLSLVGAMPFDPGNQRAILGPTRSHGLQNAVDGGVPTMFVVDVDGAEQI
jgi:hypothetical protein